MSAISLCVLAMSLPVISAHAEDKFIGNINAGDWAVGGSLTALHHSGANQTSYNLFGVSPSVQYFVIDRLSVGGYVNYTHYAFQRSNIENDWSIGPIATYHFLTAGTNLAFYVSGSMNYTHTNTAYDPLTDSSGAVIINGTSDSTSHWQSVLAVGANYFFTPSVALGPGVSWVHDFSGNSFTSGDQEQFFVQFSIFL
jgi:hypothetical protein